METSCIYGVSFYLYFNQCSVVYMGSVSTCISFSVQLYISGQFLPILHIVISCIYGVSFYLYFIQ